MPVAAFYDASPGYTVAQSSSLFPVLIDPGGNPNTVQQYTVSWGDGSATETDPGSATSFTHIYSSEASNGYTATVTATGSDGTYTDTPVINEVAPTLALTGPAPANEGSTFTLTAAMTDGDTGENYSWQIDWGDSSDVQTLTAPAGSFTYVYSEAGTYTVSALVSETDDAAGQGDFGSATVSVNEANPAYSAPAVPSTVSEGATATVTPSFSDPGGDPLDNLTVVWGDGSTDAYNGSPATAAHQYAEAGTYTATSVFSTEDGLYSATTTITATEVAPVVSPFFTSATYTEGTVCQLNVDFTDTGSKDSPTGYTIVWGDGQTDSSGTNPDPQGVFTHTYTEASPAGGYTVTATVTADDGAYSATTGVTILDATPALTLSGLGAAVSGQPYTLHAFFSDPDGDPAVSYTVDWDGSGTVQTFTSPTFIHSYPTAYWPQVATVTVATEDNPAGAATASYTIGVVSPGGDGAAFITGSSSVSEGATYSATAIFTDPVQVPNGFTAGAFWTVCWGDGVVDGPTTYPLESTFPLAHSYAEAGTYTMTIGATYEDGSDPNHVTYDYEATQVTAVTISEVTPHISASGDTTATVTGDKYSLYPSFHDSGSADIPRKWTVTWGDGQAQLFYGGPVGGTVTHIYASAGGYTPSLSVVSDDGTYSATTNVTIGQPVMNVIQGDGTPMNHDDQHDMGAFLVLNNDDDGGNYEASGNPIPDLSYTTSQSYADPDLLQVSLQPLPAAVGGTYSLAWNTTDFRAWKDPYKSAQLTNGTTFSATAANSVAYLEAIAVPQTNSDVLAENWQGGPGGALVVGLVDNAKLKVLTVNGPQNVPAYGTYSYSVSGGVPHNKANSWKITDGLVTGTNPVDSRTFIQWTKANAGTAGWVGKADFVIAEKAANYEVHAMSPNVVNVVVTTPNNAFVPGHVTDADKFTKEANNQRKQVSSGDITQNPPEPGLAWAASVTLNGPNNNAGVKRIMVGFVQNATQFTHHGTYSAGAQVFTMTSRLQSAPGAKAILDEVAGATRPWYANGATFLPTSNDPAKDTAIIRANDRPFDGPPLFRRQRGGGVLNHMYLEYDFELDVVGQTQDDANGSKRVFVKQSNAVWKFNGDGAVDSQRNYKWTPDAEAKDTPPTAWSAQITTGEMPVVSEPIFNDLLHNNDIFR